jgi:cytochrome c oxidase subunit IV
MKRMTKITGILLLLLGLTGATFSTGHLNLGGEQIVWIILALTFIKGQLVADYFMGLKVVSWHWRLLIFAWLGCVMTGIALAYHWGLKSL